MAAEVLEKDTKEKRGFLLDGFPRTEDQARALDKIFRKLQIKDVVVVSLDVPEDELITRLIKRGKESGRSDDTADTIRRRLEVYRRQTSPVLDYYKQRRKIRAIDGLGTIEAISRRINAALKEFI
jgi:adenylate kinase